MRIDKQAKRQHVMTEAAAEKWAAVENQHLREDELGADILCRIKPVPGGFTVVAYDVETGAELGPI